MRTVLLALESEDFRLALQEALCRKYRLLLCADAQTGMQLLGQKPDVLVLDLSLPGTDGLTFLENAAHLRPPVILALCTQITPYLGQALSGLGVGYAIRKPCTLPAVTGRISDMLRKLDDPLPYDPQLVIRDILMKLSLPLPSDGFQQLRIGIPLFAQDKSQRLSKELYPAIAELYGCSAAAVEHSIRESIETAWESRDAAVWQEYFPGFTQCPTNKCFIARLAELLDI